MTSDNIATASSTSKPHHNPIGGGRKRKTPTQWASEYEEFEVKKRKEGDSDVETLIWKYCSFEINEVGPGKKPWDRVHEYLASKHHSNMKDNYKKRMAEKKTADNTL